jgi:hypothetical protein
LAQDLSHEPKFENLNVINPFLFSCPLGAQYFSKSGSQGIIPIQPLDKNSHK